MAIDLYDDGIDTQSIDRMGTGKISSLLIEFSIPAIIGLVISALYTFFDGIFIGIGVGDAGIAATTSCYPMVVFSMAVAMLIGNGGNSLAAIRLGEQKHDEAERILGNTTTLCIVVPIVMFILSWIFLDPILEISGSTPDSIGYARIYLLIILAGGLFQCFAMGISNFIRTSGAPMYAMVVMAVGAVINIVLDYLFVLVFHWGMVGAGVATDIGEVVSAYLVFRFFKKRKSALLIRRKYLKLEAPYVKSICALGLSSFVLQFAYAVVNIVMNRLFIEYGGADVIGATGALAAMGVIERVGQLFFLPIIGVATGMQPLVGYNYGATRWHRVRRTFWLAVLFATVVVTVLWAIAELFPEPFVTAFGLEGDVLAFGIWGLRIYMIMCPILGFEVIGSNYFQATGQAVKATVLTLLRQVFILIPLLIITPMVLPGWFPVSGVQSIFIAIATSDVVSTLIVGVFVFIEMRHMNERCRLEDETASAMPESDEVKDHG